MTGSLFIISFSQSIYKRKNKSLHKCLDFANGGGVGWGEQIVTVPGNNYFNFLIKYQHHTIKGKKDFLPVVKVPSGMKKAPIIIATAAANLKNQNLKQQKKFFINKYSFNK